MLGYPIDSGFRGELCSLFSKIGVLAEGCRLKKKYILPLVGFVFLGFLCFFKWNYTPVSQGAGDALVMPVIKQAEEGAKEIDGDTLSIVSSGYAEEVWNPMGDAISSEEIKKWFAARGNYSFFGPESLSDYQGYDLETLTRLSDAGDIKAMHVLADRANNFADLRSILFKASIYGSTEALIQLGSLNENDEGNLKTKPVEVQKAKILTALAYYEVAQIRGDWWGNIASGKSLIERYKVNLTEQDKLFIKNLSEQIYNDLQLRRSELGLGKFDNNVPDSVIKFYEEMVRPL